MSMSSAARRAVAVFQLVAPSFNTAIDPLTQRRDHRRSSFGSAAARPRLEVSTVVKVPRTARRGRRSRDPLRAHKPEPRLRRISISLLPVRRGGV
jgi:hypothetical protein